MMRMSMHNRAGEVAGTAYIHLVVERGASSWNRLTNVLPIIIWDSFF